MPRSTRHTVLKALGLTAGVAGSDMCHHTPFCAMAKSCPKCSGYVKSAGGTDYECVDCGTTFDVADLFLP